MIFDILLDLTQQEDIPEGNGPKWWTPMLRQVQSKKDDPDDPASLEDINSRNIPLSFTSSLMSKRFTSTVSLFQLSVDYPFWGL